VPREAPSEQGNGPSPSGLCPRAGRGNCWTV
jgi:hypothetical protein